MLDIVQLKENNIMCRYTDVVLIGSLTDTLNKYDSISSLILRLGDTKLFMNSFSKFLVLYNQDCGVIHTLIIQVPIA